MTLECFHKILGVVSIAILVVACGRIGFQLTAKEDTDVSVEDTNTGSDTDADTDVDTDTDRHGY